MTARSPGMGTGGFRADTTSLEAQAWFDYGLQLSHAFYHEDAKVAMDKAVSIDPECSICTSGRAWVLGPTLNYPIDDTQRRVALAAAERARSLAKPTDLLAKQLADALVARYAPGAPGVSEPAFGREMLSLAERNPDIADLAVLASHSLLIPVRANDKSGLKPALKLLEGALSKRPDDTGAIHFFIHATEFDGRAEDAIGFAERLGILAPAASHLVHMPAHTFFHAGRYQDAALVNAEAIGVDRLWMSKGGDRGKDGTPMYYSHNLAFGVAGAMMSGDAALALKFASHAKTIWPESAPTGDRSYPISRTYVVLARYAPEEALKLQRAAEFNPRLDTYLHYARGEAFLGLGDLSSARKEVGELETVISRMGKSVLPEAEVAINVLRGRIAMRAGRHEEAIRRYAVATSAQEKKLSDIWDPPLWWYPVRRSLAAAYLASDDFVSAEREARASLSQWKNDPLALFVLGKSLQAQGKTSEGATALDQSRRSWRGDFSSLSAEII
jgi:tetratricopeptide (TPR) repeat protein